MLISRRGWVMAGFAGLVYRVKKCQARLSILNRSPIRSVVFMDVNGEMILEDGVEYNERGVLLVPAPMGIDEWEAFNMRKST